MGRAPKLSWQGERGTAKVGPAAPHQAAPDSCLLPKKPLRLLLPNNLSSSGSRDVTAC